jgi:hypothetical protein
VLGSAGPTTSSGSEAIAMMRSALPSATQRDTACGPKNSSDTIAGRTVFGTNGEWMPPVSDAEPTTNTCDAMLIMMNALPTRAASIVQRMTNRCAIANAM